MKRILAAIILMTALPGCAMAGEGDPMLSVDDLITLEESYEAFLSDVEDLIVSRGLLSEEERGAWHDAQMGDFYQNGGYGSILINYMPGVLDLVREEDTLQTLRCELEGGYVLELLTMRRYTPQDSSLSGLILTFSMQDAQGMPVDAMYTLGSSTGVFLKWDAMAGTYATVGASAAGDGETLVWSGQTPLPGAKNPVITVAMVDMATQMTLPGAVLELTVEDDGYAVGEDALTPDSRTQAAPQATAGPDASDGQ